MLHGKLVSRGRLAAAALITTVTFAAACAPPPPPLTPQQQVDTIIDYVEAVRGHSFVTRPDVEFVPDALFQQHVVDSLTGAQAGLDIDEVAFKALGWMKPGDDLYDKYRTAFGGSVVGFYDPVSKVLEVRGSELTPYRREVVAHELTHALDDQLFDLNESYGDGVLNEQQIGFLIGVEGSAVRVQRSYVANVMTPLEQVQNVLEQLSFQIDPEIYSVPIALLSLSQTPYLQGPEFVGGLGGNAGIDAMFSRYPTTAEQAWDPAKYLANEPAEAVAVPPADGTVVTSGTWGQFLTTLILANGISLDAKLNPVTDGWAGDAFVTWTAPGESCIRIDTRSDTAAQATALRSELSTWSAGQPDASAVSTDATTTRLSACVPTP